MLTGDVPVVANPSWNWQNRVVVPVHTISRRGGESIASEHAAFVLFGHQWHRQVSFEHHIPDGLGSDFRLYRTKCEIRYIDSLVALETSPWRIFTLVRQEADMGSG
eukprot:gb/GEZJ01003771.1/.p2 GENE.gb/GEZJ01003771.1/~~gb/GEZJ01003771.1/.p2  ORF type:complete len:106 (+),score=7.18 gb/GEZJ01003771.1/:1567-1884(+)